MTSRLALIKELREKGATIKMIDDVAAHVGSYESPLFVSTVEVIIKIKNMVLEQPREQKQGVSVADDINAIATGENTKGADFDAARAAIESDDEMSDDERKKMLEHLAAVETSRDSYIEADNFRKMEEMGVTPASNNKKRKGESRNTKSTLADKLNKLASQLMGDKQKQQTENIQRENAMRLARQAQQQRGQQQQQTSMQSGAMLKMNLLKMKLLSSLKVQKDTSIYGNEQWRASQQTNRIQVDAIKDSSKKNTLNNTSKENKKTSQELISSQSIDQIIKSDKAKNSSPSLNNPEAEKGKFQQQVGEKAGPRANEEAVAKMQAQEAISKLQNSGMRTNAPDATAATKAEMDKLAQQQAQQAQQQKQR